LADFFAAFFMAMGWLLVSGLAGTAAQSELHRGSRTRDQPPTREARRDGSCSDARARHARRRKRPHRWQARRVRAGQQKTRHAERRGSGIRRSAEFSRERRCPCPPCDASGRRAVLCCALSRCLDSLASAVQVCLGRNLITVFSTVNNPRQENPWLTSSRRPARAPCAVDRAASDARATRDHARH